MKSKISKNSKKKYLDIIIVLGLFVIMAFGCSSGGNDDSSSVLQGRFLDTAVGGLEYETETQSGLTDSDGTFNYKEGEDVTFFIGGIVLGDAPGDATVTPVDLVEDAEDETNPTVTKITQLLLTVDEDGDPDNGITITEEVRTAAEDMTVDFENEDSVQEAASELTAGESDLVDADMAQDHLGATLMSIGEPVGATEEPVTDELATEEPATEEPATEEPATEEPATEEPATEEPATEEPATEEPATEEPATEEPATEEPATEEPATEEPATLPLRSLPLRSLQLRSLPQRSLQLRSLLPQRNLPQRSLQLRSLQLRSLLPQRNLPQRSLQQRNRQLRSLQLRSLQQRNRQLRSRQLRSLQLRSLQLRSLPQTSL